MSTFEDGYHDLPPGKLAAVVTYLEMRTPAPPRPRHDEGLSIRQIHDPGLDWYRSLFRAVGRDWLWCSRLRLSDAELAAVLNHPMHELFVVEHRGRAQGLLELNRRNWPDVELDFFGLTPDLIGRGAGRFLMNFAIDRAFSHQPQRFFLHTCTLDHPRAVEFYVRSGFRAYKRAIEIFDDPRLTGEIACDAAQTRWPVVEME